MDTRRLRVGLVGCGQIADAHLQEIRKIPCAELVGVCDRHLDLAKQAGARFHVPDVFDDLDQMLAKLNMDVLHVTTPPHTHKPIALAALVRKIHIYLEKPFAVDLEETKDVLAVAQRERALVCVGHDQLFDPVWEECRRIQRAGALGDVVHVESLQGYDLSGPFGTQLASEPDHWVHRLPGGLFQNTISHALYKIADFLPDECPDIWATWFKSNDAMPFPSELRVFLQGSTVTGSLVFTSAARPVQRIVRVYGRKKTLEIDFDARVIREQHRPTLPGALGKIEIPVRQLREAATSLRRNLSRFLRSDLQYFAGMNRLFQKFYRAILDSGAAPIPYREIERVTGLMDAIFRQCGRNSPNPPAPADSGNGAPTVPDSQTDPRPEERVSQ
jgi:predicted dehydrogenase